MLLVKHYQWAMPHRRELKRKCNNLQKVLRTGYANAGWEALACLFMTFPECKKF